MNEIAISKTAPDTKKYPLHQHNYWEVMYYLSGSGYLATSGTNLPFSKGSIIIVPPHFLHGSVSEDGFVNISIGCDFDNLFRLSDIVVIQDNADFDGRNLATMIYKNQHKSNTYIASICSTYAYFILENLTHEKNLNHAIGEIINAISENFSDAKFDITDCLKQSGYAEDYIRAEFKRQTKETPIDFITKTRITHAKKLIEIYGDALSVADISEACGFYDATYFSRRFRQFVGMSPTQYKLSYLTQKAR